MAHERDTAPPGADGVETDLRARFGERLREVRRERGLTQAAVADLAGLTQQYVAMIESGRINPTLDTMAAVARVLGREVSEILRSPKPHD